MDLTTALIIVGLTLVGNIIGVVYSYGKLTQRVKNLNDASHSMAEMLKDLNERVNNVSENLASLEGTVKTFIDLVKKDGVKKNG